jgi:hypothetical protein
VPRQLEKSESHRWTDSAHGQAEERKSTATHHRAQPKRDDDGRGV